MSKHRRRYRRPGSYRPELVQLESREGPNNLLSLVGAGAAPALNIFAAPSEQQFSGGPATPHIGTLERQAALAELHGVGGSTFDGWFAKSPAPAGPASATFAPSPIDGGMPSTDASAKEWFHTGPVVNDPIQDPLQPSNPPQPSVGAAPGLQAMPVPPPSGGGGGGGGGQGSGGGGGGGQADHPGPDTGASPPAAPQAISQASAAPASASLAPVMATSAQGAAVVSGSGNSAGQTTPESFQAAPAPAATQPVAFELNQGQADSQYQFIARNPGYNLFLNSTQAVLNLASANGGTADTIKLTFAGGSPAAAILPGQQLGFHSNYFVGGQAIVDVPNYAGVQVQNLYTGVGVHYYGNAAGQLEYDIVVAPGADLSQVRMQYQGVASMATDNAGNLVLHTADGNQLVEHAPSLYQQAADGARVPVAGQFSQNGDGTIGIAAGAYDPARPLIVDPTLDYSGYLGGSGADTGTGIAADGSGNAFVVGQTPALSGTYSDLYVAKLSANGNNLLYKTYIGGTGNSQGTGVAVDPAGNAVAVGTTVAGDFPVTSGAILTTMPFGGAGFATRLNAAGDAVLYGTYLAHVTPSAVTVSALGQAYITGSATSGMTTTTGAYETTLSGTGGGFVAELNPAGTTYVYSTYFAGTGMTASSFANAIAVDPTGNAYLAGYSGSSSFPITTGAAQTTFGGGSEDAFVSKLNATATSLVYSTFVGGSGADLASGIAVDAGGNAYITGSTTSAAFPTTTGVLQTSLSGSQDAFVTKLNSAGTAFSYSTYLGGSSNDQGNAIGVAPGGSAIVVGTTTSSNFPSVNALPGTGFGGFFGSGFLTELNATATSLVYSTSLSSSGLSPAATVGNAVAVDADGTAYVAGTVNGSNSYPTSSHPYQATYGGGSSDAFVVKADSTLDPPVITAISSDTGASSTDFITNVATQSISGTAPPSVTVRLYLDTVPLGTTTSNSGGSWSYNYTGTSLPDGTYTFTARSESSGKVSVLSAAQLVTVDTTAPLAALQVPAAPTTLAPIVTVQASDLVGIPAGATVTLDVDLNNNGNFTDAGETGYASGSLVNGLASIPVALAATGTYRVRARVTDTAGNQATSSAQTFTIGTVSSPWTLTDSTIRTSELADGNPELQLGDLQVAVPLDLDRSPGSSQSGNPELVYNSNLVSVKPIVQATLITDNAGSLPATITATLTWNGTAQTPVNFSTTGFHAGDRLTLAVQSTAAVTSTGRDDWSLSVSIPGHTTATANGVAYVRSEDASVFGAGWTLSNVSRLIALSASGSDPAGELWLYGNGAMRFFQGTTGTLTSPAEDNGALVVNTGGSLTYTAPDGSKIDFNSSGLQTDWVSPDGLTSMGYAYTSGNLTGFTAIDGGTTTISYNSMTGLFSSIAAPGSRYWTPTLSSGDLTGLSDPVLNSLSFTYTSHRLTDQTKGSLANHWAYSSSGLLSTLRWGGTGSPSSSTLASANAQGLGGFVVGTPVATLTDPLGNKTVSGMDDAGRLLGQRAADGGLTTLTRDSAGRVATSTDALGNVTTYTRDSLGYVTQVTLPDSHTELSTYQTAFHALLTSTDANGNVTTDTYDTLGHLLTVTDAAGNVTSNTYSATTGLLTSTEDALGRYTTYGYDTDRRVTSVATLLGTTSYGYDTTTGEVATITDALSHTTTLTHDAAGNLTGEATPDGHSQSWAFNNAGLVTSYTDKSGTVKATAYDAYGRGLVGTVTQASGTAVAATTVNSYDNAGQLISVQDAVGNVTQYTLDAIGRTVLTTDGVGNSSRSVYDLNGNVTDSFDASGAHMHAAYSNRGWATATTDAMGNVTSFTHDANGNLTAVEDPLTHVTSTGYSALNQVVTVTDPLTHVTSAAYWGDGTVKSVTDPLSHVTSTTVDLANKKITTTAAAGTGIAQTTIQFLDADGRVIASQDALSHTTTLTRNTVGDVTAITNPLSEVTTITLDAMGRTTAVTDPRGYTTSYTLNALGQRTQVTDPTSNTTQNALDALGHMVATIDGAGNLSTSVYNANGANTVSIDADGHRVYSQFDAVGRQVSFTDANGNTTTWQFDRDGNKIAEIDPNGGTITWTFNAGNQLTATTDQLGRSETYTYNAGGQLTTELWKNSSGTTVNTLTFTYNAVGQVLTAADTNGTYTFTYDALGRLATQQDIWGITTTFGYDAANDLTSETDSLGGTVTNTYNAGGQLTEKQFSDTSSNTLSLGYTYNADGEISQLSRYSDASVTTLIGSTSYGYDNADRGTSITHKNGAGTTIDSYTYTFNSAGLVATLASTLAPSASYTYDAAGQITGDGSNTWSYDNEGNRTTTGYSTTTGNELSSDGTWNYTYDAVGNQIQKTNISTGAVWLYTYDNANHLVEADHKPSSGGSIDEKVLYAYDVLGNRIEMTVDPDGTGLHDTITKFAYDPNGNAWADLNNSSTLITRRIYGDATDVMLARIDSSGTAWYLTDNLGSVRDIVGSTGTLLDHRDYAVFGTITNETHPTVGDRYGFTSREFDSVTGLGYNRARDVDYTTGRWTSQDPKGFAAGDTNLYRYVQNSPTNLTDPSGQDPPPNPRLGRTWGQWGEIAWAGLTGAFDGGTMVANAGMNTVTLGNSPLNNRVDQLIRQNGGGYAFANGSAQVGVAAAELAGGAWALRSLRAARLARTTAAGNPFQGLTNPQIVRSLPPGQIDLLRQWMGTGAQGARNAIGRSLPQGLTAETLRAYAEIARRQIAANLDTVGAQAARLALIEEALRGMGR